MPVAGPHNACTPTVIVEETIESVPVLDERIDQDKPAGDRDSPPGDIRLPTLLAPALILGPFRMERLESPKTFDDLARRAV